MKDRQADVVREGRARSGHRWLWGVVAVLAVEAVAAFASGAWSAWALQGDNDMQERAAEYLLFRNGIYPDDTLEPHPAPLEPRYTPYPPYAFPYCAFFFEPGGVAQGRILIEVLSIAAFVVMGALGWRTLAPFGASLAAIGGVVGAAIAGNGTAIGLGQFSIICAGLIAAQILLLDRGRPVAAGVCWALAMIKPQIALPFLLLFLVGRNLVGPLVGAAILAASMFFATAWTGVPMVETIAHWTGGMSLEFFEDSPTIGPGMIARLLRVDHRLLQIVALALMAAAGVPVFRAARRLGAGALLPAAGLCAVAGMFFSYHRHYDNVMLVPAVLALLERAAATRRAAVAWLAVAMVALLLVPQRLLENVPYSAAVQGIVWMLAGLLPLRLSVAAREGDGGAVIRSA